MSSPPGLIRNADHLLRYMEDGDLVADFTEEIRGVLLTLYAETDAAVLVSDTTRAAAVWLPRSQIVILDERFRLSADGGRLVEIECPEWFAKEKGLLG